MYDFVGDVHSCYAELWHLLEKLGYTDSVRPEGRHLVFVGDLIDRGPNPVDTLSLVMTMVQNGVALVVMGNHDDKLHRYLQGRKIQPKHGLQETIKAIEAQGTGFRDNVKNFLSGIPVRRLLDDGKVITCHAGLPEHMHLAPETGKVRSHALYGDTDGTLDEEGLPVRKDWAKDYTGSRIVVHGHVPVREPDICNNVWDIDTGVCFGNKLTALRYPEMEIVSVPALKVYKERKW